jgi:hypothetical protein
VLAAADEAPALNRGARQPRVRLPRKPSGHSTCPVVVIPDFADTMALIKKVLTAWRETQHPCAALVQSRHPQNLADG